MPYYQFRMLAILKAPFPPNYTVKKAILTAVLVGVFVGLFLYLFKPFGIQQGEEEESFPQFKYIGLGVMSFLGVVFVEIILPRLFPSFFEEESYTVGSEIITGVITILVITIFNLLFIKFISDDNFGLVLSKLFVMLWQVFLIGIFPLTLMTLLKYNSLLKSNLAVSSQIQIASARAPHAEMRESLPSITLSDDHTENTMDLSGLLYVESEGNYVNVVINKNGELTKQLNRKTLKSVESELQNRHIQRCHRSYIVNLQKVVEVSGNAQGLKLTFKDCDKQIPVSRKYISDVKSYFTQAVPSQN